MKQYQVELFYIREPPVVERVCARDSANALRIACMNAQARGWPALPDHSEVKEI